MSLQSQLINVLTCLITCYIFPIMCILCKVNSYFRFLLRSTPQPLLLWILRVILPLSCQFHHHIMCQCHLRYQLRLLILQLVFHSLTLLRTPPFRTQVLYQALRSLTVLILNLHHHPSQVIQAPAQQLHNLN